MAKSTFNLENTIKGGKDKNIFCGTKYFIQQAVEAYRLCASCLWSRGYSSLVIESELE